MDKKWKIFLVASGCLFLAVFLVSWHAFSSQSQAKMTMKIDGRYNFQMETAITQDQKSRGLGKREEICENCGMFFLFDVPGQYSFWMKDMQFPLDILWIRGDKIVYIARNIPPDFSGTLKPAEDADRVVEINAGLCDRLGINKGSQITFLGL